MTVYIGVDIGSLTTKVVIVTKEGKQLGRLTARTGYGGRAVAEKLIDQLLQENDLTRQDIGAMAATGYGRVTFPADREVSEITCQAKGIIHLFPGAGTVIDIGGQDSKVIRVMPGGKVMDFAMNDKCAAGTGRFLEVMAGALEVSLEEVGPLSLSAGKACTISSFCTVFAESEVISHVSQGTPKEEILAGICDAVASRVAAMTARTGLELPVIFTGGVAKNQGVAVALARHLGAELKIPRDPEITAALGAAFFAAAL